MNGSSPEVAKNETKPTNDAPRSLSPSPGCRRSFGRRGHDRSPPRRSRTTASSFFGPDFPAAATASSTRGISPSPPPNSAPSSATAKCGAVATIEHLMAALCGLGVDNVLVEIDGAGSSDPRRQRRSLRRRDRPGRASSSAAPPRRYLKVLKPVRVDAGQGLRRASPNDAPSGSTSRSISATPIIGRQRRALIDLAPRPSAARSRGPAPSASCATSRSSGRPASRSAPRSRTPSRSATTASSTRKACAIADEFVRHKILDAIGDLALAGSPLLGTYRSFCGGHRLNFAVLEALFSDRSNYAVVEGGTRRETGYAEIGNGIAVPAFAPDTH